MQVLNSLRSAKQRHPDCQIVKRKGRLYVICKSNPRFKAVQGRKNGVKERRGRIGEMTIRQHKRIMARFLRGQG